MAVVKSKEPATSIALFAAEFTKESQGIMEESGFIQYVPMVLMFFVAAGFVGLTMVATHMLGPKRKTKVKLESFECGIEPLGTSRTPFNIKYFLVAILFVLFDVEVIFMYPYAVNLRELKMAGLVSMLLFVALLLLGFFYIKKKGALTWEE